MEGNSIIIFYVQNRSQLQEFYVIFFILTLEQIIVLKGYDYGSFTYFNIVKYKLLNKIEKQ